MASWHEDPRLTRELNRTRERRYEGVDEHGRPWPFDGDTVAEKWAREDDRAEETPEWRPA